MGSLVAALQTVQLLFQAAANLLRASSSCPWASAVGSEGRLRMLGECFLLTCRLRDGGSRDGEIFLQRFCARLAKD